MGEGARGGKALLKLGKKKDGKEKEKTPTVWLSLKRSLQCKSEPSEVHEPKSKGHIDSILNRKPCRSGCSRSIANLKDVIHGSKRHLERKPSCSPRSIGSSEFLNPITHEVILSNSKCELRITGFSGGHDGDSGVGSVFEGTLRPGTPGPGGHLGARCNSSSSSFRGAGGLTPPRRSPTLLFGERDGHGFGGSSVAVFENNGGGGVLLAGSAPRAFFESAAAFVACHKCREQFLKLETLEAHHLSKHAVTELVEGDSSRKIVEIICRTSWLKSESNCGRIERILKVHNMQKTLARFEEHREAVKNRASKLLKKHPRCLADGNELLRFHGTTVACNLGMNGSSSLCDLDKCSVCRIIRHGFSAKKELRDGVGVFTTSTSARAFQSIELYNDGDADDPSVKKVLLVCRVIAGRVHKPLENLQEITHQSGFDSLAGRVGLYSNIEELYLLNPRALLPCFVVICKA